jgi:hypothetical protein
MTRYWQVFCRKLSPGEANRQQRPYSIFPTFPSNCNSSESVPPRAPLSISVKLSTFGSLTDILCLNHLTSSHLHEERETEQREFSGTTGMLTKLINKKGVSLSDVPQKWTPINSKSFGVSFRWHNMIINIEDSLVFSSSFFCDT